MTDRGFCSLWILLAAVTLCQLWRGITGQDMLYTIDVASSVSVQEGLGVTIPCKFTADGRKSFSNSFGYWKLLYSDSVVATNDKSIAVEKPNFHLTGNPDSGDCTLTITDARTEDMRVYYFRFEESKNSKVKYNYHSKMPTVTVTGITGQVPKYSVKVASRVSVQECFLVTIPCNFTADGRNTFNNSFGYWRQMPLDRPSIVATNGKASAGLKNNFHLTGNPDSGDCTLTITGARREDEGKYYFRFEESKDSNVKYSYYKEVTTMITVTGSTGKVWGYSMEVTSSIIVQEGLNVTIPCKFTADCRNKFTNSFGYWMRMPQHQIYIVATNDKSSDVQKTNFHLTGNPDSGDCTLTITDARREDEGIYYFRFEESKNSKVKYSYNGEKTMAITVTEPPTNMKITITSTKVEEHPASQPVDIDPKETLTLVCTVDVNPTVTMVWLKGEVVIESSKRSGLSAMINVTSSMADVYRCLAWNALGFTEQQIQVGIKPDLKVISGIIIGIIVVVSVILMGIVFLVRRKKKSTEPNNLTNGSPDCTGTEEDVYANMPVVGASGRSFTTKDKHNSKEKAYINLKERKAFDDAFGY